LEPADRLNISRLCQRDSYACDPVAESIDSGLVSVVIFTLMPDLPTSLEVGISVMTHMLASLWNVKGVMSMEYSVRKTNDRKKTSR
jgi:hypothetical protein